jgi:hypothetical protein
MTPGRQVRSLTVHAERLHEPQVWSRVRRLLDRLERRQARVTFFVFPLRAWLAGVDLRPVLDELTTRGHEVGQHTHYYVVGAAAGGAATMVKRTDLASENVRASLDRDLRYLRDAGARPSGFVSGAWVVDPVIDSWLAQHQFAYDCTWRSYPLRYPAPATAAGDRQRPARRSGLLQLPTTGPVSDLLRPSRIGRRGTVAVGDVGYRLLYLHDYDLLEWRYRLLVDSVVAAGAVTGSITARQLADQIDAVLGTGPRD